MLFTKGKQQDLLRDRKYIFDSIVYFTRVYMICLIFPSASQLPLIGQLQARAKLSAFEYENKESRKVITTPKDRTGHSLKRQLTEIQT